MLTTLKKLSGGIAALGLLLGFTGTASAAYIDYTWTDTNTWSEFKLRADDGGYGYRHDISQATDKDAYRPGIDKIDSAWLSVWLTDDSSSDGGEEAEIDISPYLLGWGLGGGGTFEFNKAFDTWEVNFLGLLDLRADGSIGIYITPTKGDFYLTKSTLYAAGERWGTIAVPEPGSLALLSIGLIGMGLALSRRRGLRKK